MILCVCSVPFTFYIIQYFFLRETSFRFNYNLCKPESKYGNGGKKSDTKDFVQNDKAHILFTPFPHLNCNDANYSTYF